MDDTINMSNYSPEKHHRESIRLEGHDYASAGAYFVTICIQGRDCLLADPDDCRLNDAGRMVLKTWLEIPDYYSGVEIDVAAVMPNHFHGIIFLEGADLFSLGDVVQRFKSLTTKKYIDGVKNCNWTAFTDRLWQRNYYEKILRDDTEWTNTCHYILNNPTSWIEDDENPFRIERC